MPLRIDEGVDIPLERSPNRELLRGVLDETVTVLPHETLVAPGEPHSRLGVTTVSQRPKELWCWAACAEMVLRFFGVAQDQCRVAGLQLGLQCCGPSSAACDRGVSVEGVGQAFGRVGLAGDRFMAMSFEGVQSQINGNPALGISPRPLVAGIEWRNEGGHLVVISGWRTSGTIRYVKVNDPWYTTGDIRYEDLVEKYGPNDNGRWVHTWANFRRV